MKLLPIAILLASALPFSAHAETKVSDAQIAAIVVTANQVDIDAGKFAGQHSTNPEVKQFAAMMVTDHTAVNKSAVDLATKLKVVPEDNDTSRALRRWPPKHRGSGQTERSRI